MNRVSKRNELTFDDGACQWQAGPSRQALIDRVARMQSALIEDDWLPRGLRSLMASESKAVREDLRAGSRSRFSSAAARVHELALTSFRYGPKLLDSEAVTQLRVLDLEMNPPGLVDMGEESAQPLFTRR